YTYKVPMARQTIIAFGVWGNLCNLSKINKYESGTLKNVKSWDYMDQEVQDEAAQAASKGSVRQLKVQDWHRDTSHHPCAE
ncbi:hypothetical protein HispidOSU_021051, partial [Sigmodon hispidus]